MNSLSRVRLILVINNVIYNASLHRWHTTRNKFLMKTFSVVMSPNLTFATAKVKTKLPSHFFLIPMSGFYLMISSTDDSTISLLTMINGTLIWDIEGKKHWSLLLLLFCHTKLYLRYWEIIKRRFPPWFLAHFKNQLFLSYSHSKAIKLLGF